MTEKEKASAKATTSKPSKPAKLSGHPADSAAFKPADTSQDASKKTDQSKQAASHADNIDQLRLALDEQKKLTASYKEAVQRSQAEQENIRHRGMQDVKRARDFASQPLLESLIPIIDSMEQGLQAFEENHDPKAIEQGMRLTHDLLAKTLERFQIQVIDPIGKPFNPKEHEAMAQQASDEHPANTVIQVLQKGYLLSGRLIRAARVIVAKK
jgi:molecular chaperone GrpE